MPHTARVALSHLRAWRTQNILTVAELAKRADLAQSTILDLENAHTTANPKTIGKLAAALGVPTRALLNPPPSNEENLTTHPKDKPSQPSIDWDGEQGKQLRSFVEALLAATDLPTMEQAIADMWACGTGKPLASFLFSSHLQRQPTEERDANK